MVIELIKWFGIFWVCVMGLYWTVVVIDTVWQWLKKIFERVKERRKEMVETALCSNSRRTQRKKK